VGGVEFQFSDAFEQRFRVDRVLGEGGAGRVYLAHDRELDRPVAVKVLLAASPESEDLKRFLEEARVCASLNHPNILPLLLNGEDQGKPFVIFQFIKGSDLATVIEARGRLPAGEAVRFACGILDGLHAAHAAGIVHRDVKPQNVLVRAPDDHPFVSDFGLARASGRSGIKTQTGIILGTPLYLSPERVLGHEATPSADVYGVACVLYEMLCGRTPFEGLTPYEAIRAHLEQVPKRVDEVVPGVPRHLAMVVERGLAKKPEDRWKSADEMAQALRSPPSESGRNTVVAPAAKASGGTRVPGAALSGGPKDPASKGRAPTRAVSTPRGNVVKRSVPTVAVSGAAVPARRASPAILAALAAGVLGVVGLAIGLASRGGEPAVTSPTPAASVEARAPTDEERARGVAEAIETLNVTKTLVFAVTQLPAPEKGRLRTAYDPAVSFLDVGQELGMMPGILPRTRPNPKSIAELARVLDRDLAPLKAKLAWLGAERERLYAPGGLPDALQRRLYAAVQQLVWRDLVLRAQHSLEKEAGHQRLHAPLVAPLEPVYIRKAKLPDGVALTGMQCFVKLSKNFDRGMLDAYVAQHDLHLFYRLPSATSLIRQFRQEPRTLPMPEIPDALRQGRVELSGHVGLLGAMMHVWVSWPAPEPGEPPVVVRLHHPGTYEALLRMDGWDELDWDFDKPPAREPKARKSLMRIGVSIPGRWLPKAGTPVTIGYDTFPGVTVDQAAQYHRAAVLNGLAIGPSR
jgi:hypothetical protein